MTKIPNIFPSDREEPFTDDEFNRLLVILRISQSVIPDINCYHRDGTPNIRPEMIYYSGNHNVAISKVMLDTSKNDELAYLICSQIARLKIRHVTTMKALWEDE